MGILLAKIKAVLRRTNSFNENIIEVKNIKLFCESMEQYFNSNFDIFIYCNISNIFLKRYSIVNILKSKSKKILEVQALF